MAPSLAPPVEALNLVTPYPHARATTQPARLSALRAPGVPLVLHLYTG